MKITTIVVAGGSGSRMNNSTPKQFLLLGGLPILMQTILALKRALTDAALSDADYVEPSGEGVIMADSYVDTAVNNVVNNFVVVLPSDQVSRWVALCAEYNFEVEHQVAIGGANRFESVRSGLAMAQGADLVIVHDGVRPLVSPLVVQQAIAAAAIHGAATPVIEVTDSLRKIVNNHSEIVNNYSAASNTTRTVSNSPAATSCNHPTTVGDHTEVTNSNSKIVDRSYYRSVQTPQVFRSELLLQAYEQPYDPAFTDDTSVVERLGHHITLTPGDPRNIKITTPTDLALAQVLITTNF